jgi:glycerol 2-dehydrogenase (NADP+)
MQKLLETGQVKNIGVSNFVISNLEKLLNAESTKVVPAVNQIELHPNMPSPKTIAYCNEKGIHVTAYSCLGSTDSPLSGDKTLLAIAEEVGKTPQQVLLMWGLQRGTSVIPKSVTASRIKGNFQLDDFELSEEQMNKLSSIPDRFKVCGHDWLPVKVFFVSRKLKRDNSMLTLYRMKKVMHRPTFHRIKLRFSPPSTRYDAGRVHDVHNGRS